MIAVLAEWQFDLLGRFRPILTYLLLLLLLGLPLYLIGFVQKAGSTTQGRAAVASDAACVAASACAAILAVALISTLPPSDGVPVRVAVADAKAPPIGPTTLEGRVIYDLMTVLDERLWFFGRNIRFVRVIAPGSGGRGSTLRYFVALPKLDLEGRDATPREWEEALGKGSLPAEIIRLYRYAGYRVKAPYYVFFDETRHADMAEQDAGIAIYHWRAEFPALRTAPACACSADAARARTCGCATRGNAFTTPLTVILSRCFMRKGPCRSHASNHLSSY